MNSTDYSEEPRLTECSDGLVDPQEVLVKKVEIFHAETYEQGAIVEDTVDTRTSQITSTVHSESEDTWASDSVEETEVREVTSPNSTQLEYEVENWASPVNSDQFDTAARSNWTSPVNCPENEAKETGTPPNSSEFGNGTRETWTSGSSVQLENRESWTSPISQETDQWKDSQASLTGSEVSVQREEKWSDTLTSPPGFPDDTLTSDTVPPCEQMSEMYYTASSEVSLLSDTEIPDKSKEESLDKEEEKECVIAGHVAAMRERFESMTRANTPCPELLRSSSPSLDVFRNITPSPDRLG